MRNLAKIIASVGGIGYIPWASGTFGSLVGVVLFLIFGRFQSVYCLLTVLITFLSFYIVPLAESTFGQDDDSRIVIDEVAGQMLTLVMIPVSLSWAVWGFILFRFFDIFKPPPIDWVEDKLGTLGVTADDLMAGVYALAILHTFNFFF